MTIITELLEVSYYNSSAMKVHKNQITTAPDILFFFMLTCDYNIA